MLLRGLFDRLAWKTLDPSGRIEPRHIHLEASSFCQLRCPSCPTTVGAIHPAIGSGFLRLENFRQLLQSSPALEGIEISNYGEVFLNPDLTQILEYACQSGVAITIANGANLNNVKEEALEALVKFQVRVLGCSIDGASAETYRKYRVRGDFNQVIRNIERINFYKRQYRSNMPHLRWQFIIFGHNEHEIPAAREMAKKLGMEFYTKLTWDSRFSPIRDKDFVRGQTGQSFVDREEFERQHRKKYAGGICNQLWENPQINWDGKVIGCCRNFWGDFGGNAFTQGVANSVNHEKMVYARQMLSGKKPSRPDIPCATCDNYIAMQNYSQFISRRQRRFPLASRALRRLKARIRGKA